MQSQPLSTYYVTRDENQTKNYMRSGNIQLEIAWKLAKCSSSSSVWGRWYNRMVFLSYCFLS